MNHFHMTETQALGYPLNRARALSAWWIMSNIPVELGSLGYIGQEADRIQKNRLTS